MRVLYYMPLPESFGADRWIYEGWRHAFRDLGHEFVQLTEHDDWSAVLDDVKPDLFFSPNLIDIVHRKKILLQLRERGTKVFLIVHWPMEAVELEVIGREEIADVYFGEREPESMVEFERVTGRKYHLIPNAANRQWHFPVRPSVEPEYDIVYLGAKLRKKRKMFQEVLKPLTKQYRCGIFGPYWTFHDQLLRGAQKTCRRLRLPRAASWINNFRIAIPPERENALYSSAKICVNFHEREDDGSQPHYIVNQRTFKIAACGGFQICDYVPALRKYFDEDEVVMARDAADWFDKVSFYLRHDRERRKIQERAAARALRDHTYHQRVREVLELYDRAPLVRAGQSRPHRRE